MPEMCSYDPGTMNWANSYVFLNTPAFLERLGKVCQELQIKPELEVFDAGMIGNIEYYLKKGILKEPCHYQLVLDVSGGMPGNLESMAYLLPKLRPGSTWSITGIGQEPRADDAGRSPPPAATACGSAWRTISLWRRACWRRTPSWSPVPSSSARWPAGKSPPPKKRARFSALSSISRNSGRINIMKLQDIRKIAVLGAGTMGPGIAQTFAMGGFSVTMWTRSEATMEKAKATLHKSLETFAEEGMIAKGDIETIYERVSYVRDCLRGRTKRRLYNGDHSRKQGKQSLSSLPSCPIT